MPQIDLPISVLQVYPGTNPRPADLDSYWDTALAALETHDPQVSMTPAAFQTPGAACFDLWFTGTGGSRIHAKYLRPIRAKGPHPAILHFHGYTGSSGAWVDHLPWVGAGYSLFALDVRGQGGESEDLSRFRGPTFKGHIIRGLLDGPEHLFYRDVFLDTVLLARIAMNQGEVDPERVYATGWSQGGALTIACAALEPRIARIAPVYPFLSDYKRVWEMDLGCDAYEELTHFFRRFDPTHAREVEMFTVLGYIDIQFLAPRVTASVLWGLGLMDTTCPPSSQFACYNKLSNTASKEMAIYPDFAHEIIAELKDRIFQFLVDQR